MGKFSEQVLFNIAVKESYKMKQYEKGGVVGETNCTIVSIQHSPDGFDAMAVRDSSGSIMIVYGGTNVSDGVGDVVTDVEIAGSYLSYGVIQPGQFEQAKLFRDRVVLENPGSDITLTGHSLGGGLSNYVALATGDRAVNFNPAPLPYEEAIIFGNGVNRTDIINYQTGDDPLSGALNVCGGYVPGQIKIFGEKTGNLERNYLIDQHNMKDVKFDERGNLVDDSGRVVSEFPNVNLSTGNAFYDELTRASHVVGNGEELLARGDFEIVKGLIMLLNPYTCVSGNGSSQIMKGCIFKFSGMLTFCHGVGRYIAAELYQGKRFAQDVIDAISTRVQEAVDYVYKGAVNIGKQILSSLHDGIQFISDVEGEIGSVLSTSSIKVGYDVLDKMHWLIGDTSSMIHSEFQLEVNRFIRMKDVLFDMTYQYIRNCVYSIFTKSEMLSFVGSLSFGVVTDVVTLNWGEIEHHVKQKIDAFCGVARRDFMYSNRGFNHELVRDVGRDLSWIESDLQNFSKRVQEIKTTFENMERMICKQVK